MTFLERDRINFVEGKEEGRTEEKIQMARELLVRGMSIDEVVAITELTKKE